MKTLVNITVIVVIALLSTHQFIGKDFFVKDFEADCVSIYNIETNESKVTCNVQDPNDLISIDYPLTISIVDSTSVVIDSFNLNAGENEFTFDDLDFSSQYTIELTGYEIVDELYEAKEYFTHNFSTVDDDFLLPIITKSDLLISDTTVSFSLELTDTNSVVNSIYVRVLDGSTTVEDITITDFTNLSVSFDMLDQLTEYQITIIATFDINDFDTQTNTLHDFSFDTLKTPESPEAEIIIISNNGVNLSFNITESDMDAETVSYTVILSDELDTIIYSEVLVSNTIDIDISSITTDYDITVISSYNLDGVDFIDVELDSYHIITNENSNFFSIPTLNIVDITVPLNSYADYDDYLYTNFNEGNSTFRIECGPLVDCVDLVETEPYSDVAFDVIGMVHSYYDSQNIGYSYTSNYIDITLTTVYTPAEIAAVSVEINNIINAVTTSEMTINEKILAVHNYIINNSVYDTACFENPITCDNDHNAVGILFDGNAVCEGYADTMDVLLRAMRIPSIRISSETHQWNGVYIDGVWLHLDATWDDPVSSGGEDILTQDYFLISTSQLNILDTSDTHTYDTTYVSFID